MRLFCSTDNTSPIWEKSRECEARGSSKSLLGGRTQIQKIQIETVWERMAAHVDPEMLSHCHDPLLENVEVAVCRGL